MKPGDTVIVHCSNFLYGSDTITKVQKITPKGFIKAVDVLFNPDTGAARGDWNLTLSEATPTVVKEITEREYIKKVLKIIHNLTKLTYKQAVDIINAVERQIPKKPIKVDKYHYDCPTCNSELDISEEDIFIYNITTPSYCRDCGQALDWSDNNG